MDVFLECNPSLFRTMPGRAQMRPFVLVRDLAWPEMLEDKMIEQRGVFDRQSQAGLEQHDLHLAFPQPLHHFRASEQLEQIAPCVRQVHQASLLRVEVRRVEDQVGQVSQLERI